MNIRIVLLVVSCLMPLACGPKQPIPQKVAAPPPAPPDVPAQQAVKIDPKLRDAAIREIDAAFASNDPILRANAIEAAQDGRGAAAADLFLRGLEDPEPLVRFAASMAVGRLRLAQAKPQLQKMAGEGDPFVAIGVRFALHRLGDKRLSHDFEKYARDPDPRVRGNTAMALGLLEEPTAINVLRSMQKDKNAMVRWQVAEGMWRLGGEEGLKALVAGSVSQFADDQMICTLALAARKDARIAEHIRGKLAYTKGSGWEEVSLVAARSMGILGLDDGYGVAQRGAASADPRQRQLAALAFGAIGRSDAQSALKNLLTDREQPVRLAAAIAILQLKENASGV